MEGFLEMTFEQRPEKGQKELAVQRARGGACPGRGNSKCKGPEAGPSLVCWGNSREANVSGEEGRKGADARERTGAPLRHFSMGNNF